MPVTAQVRGGGLIEELQSLVDRRVALQRGDTKDDGDPVDVLVITPVPLISGVVVTCRPIGILKMSDEAGGDNKLLAVPIEKILSLYTQWQKPEDLNPLRLQTIQHFFEHYKDLEPGKWVKVLGWEGPEGARQEVQAGMTAWAARHRG
jgi:inorganic pyrophosphatase